MQPELLKGLLEHVTERLLDLQGQDNHTIIPLVYSFDLDFCISIVLNE